MKVEPLKPARMKEFIAYCKRHRTELDDSFLCDSDLEEFKVNEEFPTYILLENEESRLKGLSVIITC
jgi:mycothiol synthase